MYSDFREIEAAELGGRTSNTVSVEVDRVADLRRAYPNYFLDVSEFTDRLRHALGVAPAPARPRLAVPSTSPKGKYDLSWLSNYPFKRGS
jgi:hypothetical protein